MPNPKTNRRGNESEKNRKGRLTEKASSFHGRSAGGLTEPMLTRPRTSPDLLSGMRRGSGSSAIESQSPAPALKLTKLLLNVTVQRSLGAVHVLMSPELTVEDLIAAALRQYTKEGRRPVLVSSDPSHYDLHYSQFSLESLNREEKLVALGSRNFFLCSNKAATAGDGAGDGSSAASSSRCSKEARSTEKTSLPWLKFIDFLR